MPEQRRGAGRRLTELRGLTEQADELAKWVRAVTLNMTVAELAKRFSYGKSSWTPWRNGSRNIPADLIDALLDGLIPDQEMRERLREEGHQLLQDAVEAEKLRVAGAPLPAVRPRKTSSELVTRLDDARLQQLEALQKLSASQEHRARLEGMVSALQDSSVQLEAEYTRSLREARSETEDVRQALERSRKLLQRADEQRERALRSAKNAYKLLRASEEKVSQLQAAARHAAESGPPSVMPAPREAVDPLMLSFDRMDDALDQSADELVERDQGIEDLGDDLGVTSLEPDPAQSTLYIPPADPGPFPTQRGSGNPSPAPHENVVIRQDSGYTGRGDTDHTPPAPSQNGAAKANTHHDEREHPANGPENEEDILVPKGLGAWTTPPPIQPPTPEAADSPGTKIVDDLKNETVHDPEAIDDLEAEATNDLEAEIVDDPGRVRVVTVIPADGDTGRGQDADNGNNANSSVTSKNTETATSSSELVQALAHVRRNDDLGKQLQTLRRRAGQKRWSSPAMATAATGQASHKNAALIRGWLTGRVIPEQEALERLVKAMGATTEEVEAFRAAHANARESWRTPPLPTPRRLRFNSDRLSPTPHPDLAALVPVFTLGFAAWTGITASATFESSPAQSIWVLLLGTLANLCLPGAAIPLATYLGRSTRWTALLLVGWVPVLLLGFYLRDLTGRDLGGRAIALYLGFI